MPNLAFSLENTAILEYNTSHKVLCFAREGDKVKKQIYVGVESFEQIREGDYFYVDKTLFIKELFENRGKVTLITRLVYGN